MRRKEKERKGNGMEEERKKNLILHRENRIPHQSYKTLQGDVEGDKRQDSKHEERERERGKVKDREEKKWNEE